MIWNYIKISEDEETVLYSFTYGKDEPNPGHISYNKKTEETKVMKPAGSHSLIGSEFPVSCFAFVIDDGFPKTRKVMIG